MLTTQTTDSRDNTPTFDLPMATPSIDAKWRAWLDGTRC
jgi:hypothetical protein